jgi:membrane-associated protease RseP (regulator of RpoE activity)
MKIFIAQLVLLMTLTACAGGGNLNIIKDESTDNKVKVARLGLRISKVSDQGYSVTKVNAKSPAESTGIMEGDLLLSVDKIKISSQKVFRSLLDKSMSSDREVEINLLRADTPMLVRVKPKILEGFPIPIKLIDLVEDSKVVIAVIAGDVENNIPATSNFDKEEWKNSIRRNITSDVERAIISISSIDDNIKLVDRTAINKILDEYKFNSSGFVSEEMRVKLGKMYGVTHIIVCEFSRFRSGRGGFQDITNRKLINIQTGIVEASDYSSIVKR